MLKLLGYVDYILRICNCNLSLFTHTSDQSDRIGGHWWSFTQHGSRHHLMTQYKVHYLMVELQRSENNGAVWFSLKTGSNEMYPTVAVR